MSLSVNFFGHIVSLLREGVVVTNDKNEIIYVNQAFLNFTGYLEEELVGKNPSLLASKRQDKFFYHVMWQSIHAFSKWEGQVINHKKDGSEYLELLSISKIKSDDDQSVLYIGIYYGMRGKENMEEILTLLQNHDPLTQLPIRRYLDQMLPLWMEQAHQQEKKIAVIALDFDDYQQINDRFGNQVGDALLRESTARLTDFLGGEDTLVRFGGDEFIIVLRNVIDRQRITKAIINLLIIIKI